MMTVAIMCCTAISCTTKGRGAVLDAKLYSSELVNGFELSNDVLFPDESACVSSLRTIGINFDVPSYLEAKRIFGDSMIESGNYRFWLAGPKTGAFGYNIDQLNSCLSG